MRKYGAFLVVALLFIATASLVADEQMSDLQFIVVKEDTGKPVRNAAVVLHSVNKDGKQEKGGIELKTDSEGKASFRGVPYGKLRIQVLARGLQTYGEDYDINQPNHTFEIKLKPPQKQYSIYDK